MMMKMDRRAIAVPALLAALLAMPMAAEAQQQDLRTPGTIRVSATGETRTPPDRAWADFGVETEAATASQAADQNARKMEAVITALVRAGVARENVRTSDFNVFPVHAQTRDGTGEPRIRGYRASNVVTAQTDDVRRVGPLVDAALAAGANRINGVRFGMRDPDRARDVALRDALRRARAEAAVLAEGMGVQLGRVLDVSTSTAPPMPFPVAYRMQAQMADATASAVTPIEPGQQTVHATVTVVFEIGG
jgi:uncharacterized protein YggE